MTKNSRFLELVRQRREQIGRKGLRRRAKKWLFPAAIERTYVNYLVQLVDDLERMVEERLIAKLSSLHAQADFSLRSDDFVDDIGQIMRSLVVGSAGAFNGANLFTATIGSQVANFNDVQFQSIIKSTLGVNPLKNDAYLQTLLKSFVQENAALIKNIPEKALSEIEGIATRGLTQGKTVREMEKEIRSKLKSTRARARLIARDQVGKLNAQLTEIRQTRLGIKEYIWNDSSDGRVRDSHRVLDGMICSWEDATVYRRAGEKEWSKRSAIGGYIGHPGTDYQCRCWAQPILDDIIDDAE